METTRQHHEAITRFLDRLKRRERGQFLLAGLGRIVVAGTWLCMGAAVALSLGVSALATTVIVLTLGLLFVTAVVALPMVGVWKQSESFAHQARKVEARLPGLRGRLITVVERANDPAVLSPVLLDRAAHHAKRVTDIITPSDVHSSRRTQQTGWAAVVSLVVVGVVGNALPVGPMDAVEVLLGSSVASLRLADASSTEDSDSEIVGDITLRYVFPEYTGLDPREVPNSDGTIIAPPGTEVQIRARSAMPFDAAAIQIAGQDPVDAALSEGRDLSASVMVTESSTWQVLLFEGREVSYSRPFDLRVEADAPPVVVISEVGQSVVPVDAPLGLSWNVTDDYGIVRVSVELDAGEGPESFVRREPIDTRLEVSGVERKTPRELGLAPGDTVTLRVVAVDNDRASGGNRGESEPLILEVLGPRGYGKNLAEYHERLRDAMLDALADFLEEPVPPAPTRQGLIAWAGTAPARLDAMREVVEDQWGGQMSSGLDGDLVRDILDASARLFRFTIITFDRSVGAGGQQPVSSDVDTFTQLHDKTVLSLEIGAFVIDSMLRQVGVSELARQAAKVARTAEDLSSRAQQNEDVDALQAGLDRLERQLEQLVKAAAQIGDHSLSEFTNASLQQAGSLLDEARQALSEGRSEDSRALMEALAEQLAQLAESLNDRQQRQQAQESDVAERFEALMENLEALSEDQSALAQKLAEKQEDLGTGFAERMSIWEQLDTLATEFSSAGAAALSAVGDGRAWSPYTIRRLTDLANLTAGTLDSVRARDGMGASRRVDETGAELPITARFVRRDTTKPAPPRGSETVENKLNRLSQLQREMATLLDSLRDTAGESNPELEAATRSLADEQGRVQDRQRELAQEVEIVENALPVSTGDATRSMGEAGSEMERARGALEYGIAVSAEGHQRRAVDRVQETREHLQQAMEQQGEMQQSMAQMQGQRRAQNGDENGQSDSTAQPEIPAPETFQTAESYREALLEGMAGEVPEEFKALKRRFYEDLVRQ